MILPSEFKVWMHSEPADMRKAINGLSALVVDNFNINLQSGDLFIFYNKNLDIIKVLYYHYNGFCVLHKKLDQGRFKIPKALDDKIILTNNQLSRLLEGLHFIKKPEKLYDTFY